MLAKYAIIIRRAGALTAVAAAVMVAVCAALGGVTRDSFCCYKAGTPPRRVAF